MVQGVQSVLYRVFFFKFYIKIKLEKKKDFDLKSDLI